VNPGGFSDTRFFNEFQDMVPTWHGLCFKGKATVAVRLVVRSTAAPMR
jgi:hypothetical protein